MSSTNERRVARGADGGTSTVPSVRNGRSPKGNRAALVSRSTRWRRWLASGLTAPLIFLGAGCSSAAPIPGNAQVDEIHLGWPGDPRTSMAVDWHTDSSALSNVAIKIDGHWRRPWDRGGHRLDSNPHRLFG